MGQIDRETAVVILAAGKGTRMKSRRAKVLHDLCGRPLLDHVLASVEGLSGVRPLVVVGQDADEVQERFSGRAEFVLQAEQAGTAHAVLQVEPKLRDFAGDVLILYSDVPLLRPESLDAMRTCKAETGADLVVLTARVEVPGIIIRDEAGRVVRVVEATDATPEERAIEERNTGVYLVDSQFLWEGLSRLDYGNAQGELYLSGLVGAAIEDGRGVEAIELEDAGEAIGINTREDLAQAGAVLRERIAKRLMADGVTLIDPAQTYVDVGVEIGRDSVIEPGCVIQGDSVLGEGVHVKAHCVIESSRLEDGVVIGPSAHLRPGSHLGPGVRVGNFVEIKNSELGAGTKADHLSYIGDATVGERALFGCGSIVVNYDGIEKHRTQVGNDVFVGCNSNLIAPVSLEEKSFIAAGSTITKEVPAGSLSVARAKQRNVEGWSARREAAGSGSVGRKSAKGTKKRSARKAGKAGKASTGGTKSAKAATKTGRKKAKKRKSSARRASRRN